MIEELTSKQGRKEARNAPLIYYKWLKDLVEAGKGRLRGDAQREATSDEVTQLRGENEQLKQLVVDLSLENLTLRKSQY
jgi:transposase